MLEGRIQETEYRTQKAGLRRALLDTYRVIPDSIRNPGGRLFAPILAAADRRPAEH